MGASACSPLCAPEAANKQYDPFRWEYGEDEVPVNQDNGSPVQCRISGVKADTLAKWQQDLKAAKRQFRDPLDRSQPVILKSLSQDEGEIKCTYERPDIFVKDEAAKTAKVYNIFEEHPSGPEEITVGDSALQYLGIFLCFLSHRPKLLRKIILSSPNSYGIHLVAMHPKDIEECMLIDDYALCHETRPLFSQPVKGEYIWPCLIERAWLKYIGHAHIIEKKTPIDVFSAFLSHPAVMHPVTEDNKTSLVHLMRESTEEGSNYRCAATSLATPQHKIGLSGRRYYYLISSVLLDNHYYYYFRDPCGAFEFRGALQNPEEDLLDAIGERLELPEGNFILEEEQFFEQMESVTVMHYNEQSSVISQLETETPAGEECLMELSMRKQTFVSLRFSQANPLPVTYHLIDLKDYSLVAGEDNQHACFGYQHSNLLPGTYLSLPQGRYLLRLKKKEGPKGQKTVQSADPIADTLTVTANSEVSFDYLRVQYLNQRLQEFYLEQGRQRQGQAKQTHVGNKVALVHTAFWLGDLVLVYIKSQVKHKQNLEVQFSNRVNLECVSHPIGSDFFLMPPLEDECVIVFEKVDLTGAAGLGKYVIDSF